MMYSNKLAVAIKSAGKVLREFNKDEVYLPFGAEYSIFIKNLDTVRASVSITIDGEDIADGDTFVVKGSSSIDIERFLKRGNLHTGNRFKFIERTRSVEQHRGVGVEDGIVVVKYKFEKRLPKIEYVDHHIYHRHHHHHDHWYPPRIYYNANYGLSGDVDNSPQWSTTSTSVLRGVTQNAVKLSAQQSETLNAVSSNVVQSDISSLSMNAVSPQGEAGITVPGSVSHQQFHTAETFWTEDQEYSIVLRLFGQTGEQQVTQPITVKHKQKCQYCGTVNKATAKFCGNCGASLEIV